jgi:hypothetical protein
MASKGLRQKGSFVAKDNQGRMYRLTLWVDIQDAGTMRDPHAELEGLTSITTESGQHVNRIDKGKYQIVATGQILTSDDPNAP